MNKRYSLKSFVNCFILSAILLFGSLPLPASAMDIPFFQNNDILYYDGSSGNGCAAVGKNYSKPTDIPGLTGKDDEEKTWNYLTGKDAGLSPEQAAGVIGVGYGMDQWTGSRLSALEAAAKEKKVTLPNLAFQLTFMVKESKDRQVDSHTVDQAEEADFGKVGDIEWETLKKQKNPADAATFWNLSFKESRSLRGEMQDLIDRAEAAFEKYKDTTTDRNETTSNGDNCTAAGSGDLAALLLEYAWPQFHEPPYTKLMPAYEEAIKKRISEGKYVGGYGDGPGVDCGGFVTTLLVNSGFEPNYNAYDSNVHNGQWPWLEENWTSLGTGGDVSTLDLQPGDVAIKNNANHTHTFVYVGEIDGFDNVYASASLGNRAPMAAGPSENGASKQFDWYRKR